MALIQTEMNVVNSGGTSDVIVPNAIANSDGTSSGLSQDANNVLKVGGTEIVSKLILLYDTPIFISGGSSEMVNCGSNTSTHLRIFWKASAGGTGQATYGFSDTYVNCLSSDVDKGYIATYNNSILTVQPYNPDPDYDECDRYLFGATAGSASPVFTILKVYKVIE